VRQKSSPSPNWTSERQNDLFRRLLNSPWKERVSSAHPEDNIEEAVVNEVSAAANVAPPSPEMRQTMRVLDLYVLDNDPTAENSEAQALYGQAQKSAKIG